MTEKNPILLLASATALTLALSQSAAAEQVTGDPAAAAPADAAEQAAPVEAQAPAPAEEPAGGDAAAESPVEDAPPALGQEAAPLPPGAAPPVAEVPQGEVPQGEVPQGEVAETGVAETAEPPTSPAVEPPPMPLAIEASREQMEQRRTEMMKERQRRYEEMRNRAAEVGMELPEAPPWGQPGIEPPEMPTPPVPPFPSGEGMPATPGALMTREEFRAERQRHLQAMRERAQAHGAEMPAPPPRMLMSDEERRGQWDKMRNMTPEERRAAREEHWQEMRKRAQEQGIELPETAPWMQMEQRRKEVEVKREKYQQIVDQMTPEQQEAARAIFGMEPPPFPMPPMGRQMPPMMPQQPSLRYFEGAPSGTSPQGVMMPSYGHPGTGPNMPGGRPAPGWYGPEGAVPQGPEPPSTGYTPW